jgi:hypothetical protein
MLMLLAVGNEACALGNHKSTQNTRVRQTGDIEEVRNQPAPNLLLPKQRWNSLFLVDSSISLFFLVFDVVYTNVSRRIHAEITCVGGCKSEY